MRSTFSHLLAFFFVAIVLTACAYGSKANVAARGNEMERLKALAKPIKYNSNYSKVSYPAGGESVLVKRLQQGVIPVSVTDSIFTLLSKDQSDTLAVLVINYYPAKTISNATGNFGAKDFQRVYGELDREVTALKGTRNIFVNRPNADLGRYADAADWRSDEYYFIERYFVPHPQLGSSYVVLDKNGNYELYLGEHANTATIKSFLRIYRNYLGSQ